MFIIWELVVLTRFPAKTEIRDEWVQIVRDGGRPNDWTPSNNTKICSLHFNLEDLKPNVKGTQIVRGANPKIPKTDMKKVISSANYLSSCCST
jgi:hypothetical protein